MSTNEDSMQCLQCGTESHVALRNERTKCAECLMDLISDPVVIDALSRAICAVIADAVKDERNAAPIDTDYHTSKYDPPTPTMPQAQSDEIQRKQDAKAATEKRAVSWFEYLESKDPGCTTRKEPFVSKNKPAMTSDDAQRRFNEKHAYVQPRGHSPEDRFDAVGIPSFTPEEVRAAMAADQRRLAEQVAWANVTNEARACTKCSADLTYADPGQTLCYGCRST